jgi:hypothetical protein
VSRSSARVGRLVAGEEERAARQANEGGATVNPEWLRSAFAISPKYLLTAWHCVRGLEDDPLWFRIWRGEQSENLQAENHPNLQDFIHDQVAYLPVTIVDHDELLDIALLSVDHSSLRREGLSLAAATRLLKHYSFQPGIAVDLGEEVQVKGYPKNAPAGWPHTISARVTDLYQSLGSVSVMKLFSGDLSAAEPVNPRGMSGGPVLSLTRPGGTQGAAIGVVRQVPRGDSPLMSASGDRTSSLGGALLATSMEEIAKRFPQVADVLVEEISTERVRERAGASAPTSLAGLLRAESELVRFFGREHELEELLSWCNSSLPSSAILVTGPGGQGKTRLAVQLCRQLTRDKAWVALIVDGSQGTKKLEGACRVAQVSVRPVLVVVDYAAEYGVRAMTDLIGTLVRQGMGLSKWRLLMLARSTGDWWQRSPTAQAAGETVQSQFEKSGVQFEPEDYELKPLVPHVDDRKAAFERIRLDLAPALEAFASSNAMQFVADPPIPTLADPDFGSALLLQIAVVMSMLPAAGPPPGSMAKLRTADVIGQILDVERDHHWLYSHEGKLYDFFSSAFGELAGSASIGRWVETAVAAATLVGAPDARHSASLVRDALEVESFRANDIASWLHNLYPEPTGSYFWGWLPPLQPDRLGEELVARVVIREELLGYPRADLLPGRLLRSEKGRVDLTEHQMVRMITTLSRIASRDSRFTDLLAKEEGLIGQIPSTIDLRDVLLALSSAEDEMLEITAVLISHVLTHLDELSPGWRLPDTPCTELVIVTRKPGSVEVQVAIPIQGRIFLLRRASALEKLGRGLDALRSAEEAVMVGLSPAKTWKSEALALWHAIQDLLAMGARLIGNSSNQSNDLTVAYADSLERLVGVMTPDFENYRGYDFFLVGILQALPSLLYALGREEDGRRYANMFYSIS